MYKVILRIFIFSIISLIFLSGCTSEDNSIGEPPVDLKPVEKEISLNLLNNFSITDSCKNHNGSKLLLGKYQNRESRILIKFSDLPDTISSFIKNPKIEFTYDDTIYNRNFDIKYAVLNTDWEENRANWFEASDSINWNNTGGDFEQEYNTNYSTYLDSTSNTYKIGFEIDNSIVQNWVNNDMDNYGLILYCPDYSTGYTFLSSDEGTDPAKMEFEYRISEDDTTNHVYNENPSSDIHITEFTQDEVDVVSEQFKLANLIPTSSALQFAMPIDSIINVDGEEVDPNKIIVNQAELVCEINESETNLINDELDIYVNVLKNEEVFTNQTISSDDYITSPTFTYQDLEIENGKISLRLTGIIQGFINGEYENNGIYVRSMNENENYDHVIFKNLDNIKLRILYSVPETDI